VLLETAEPVSALPMVPGTAVSGPATLAAWRNPEVGDHATRHESVQAVQRQL